MHATGEVNDTLNACDLNAASCVSTFSDDEKHFITPWSFDAPRPDAIEQLIRVATGGAPSPCVLRASRLASLDYQTVH